ncbi:MAG: HesB/IscA family protein [Bryobacteraceae bacterium]
MPSITVTPLAVRKIRESFQKTGVEGGLRLGVLGGGCSGLSYQFKFEPQPRPSDLVYNFDDVQVYVDPKSIVFLDGMTLDYKESLMHSGFEFLNPHATKSCGCGSSFST